MLKIIAGEYRSRKLLSPDDDRMSRPYGGRVKESVFNLLRGWYEGAHVLDLFSGVGTMGLEAISRGAARAVMVERDREVYALLKRNIEMLGCGDRAEAVHAEALSPSALDRAPAPVNLVFIDPPYQLMEQPPTRERVLNQVARCRAIMADEGFLVLRSPTIADAPELRIDGFEGPEVHRYGAEMNVLLYAPAKAIDNQELRLASD